MLKAWCRNSPSPLKRILYSLQLYNPNIPPKGIYQSFDTVRSFMATSYGATRSRSEIRRPESDLNSINPLHYPPISKITKKPFNWMFDTPQSGFFGSEVFGPNTLEIKGLPPCRTPEYMQERLRKFFSKYGIIETCRCLPHHLDPYQCSGIAYITFREAQAAVSATHAKLKFPPSLQNKLIRIKNLDTLQTNDVLYIKKKSDYSRDTFIYLDNIYNTIKNKGPMEIKDLIQDLQFDKADPRMHKGSLNYPNSPDDLRKLISQKPLNQLFDSKYSQDKATVGIKTFNSRRKELILRLFTKSIKEKYTKEYSVSWRMNKQPLPRFLLKKLTNSKYNERLNSKLQTLSRNSKFFNVYDERMVFRNKLKQEKKKKI